jgi:mono/diheme cytochrome c family protein/predicted  nucleic acid-binding Zn-ribbon protein
MADRPVDEESRSYSALFLIAVALLLAGSIWSIYDDNIARRPWKKYQATFFDMERKQVEEAIAREERRLAEDPKFQETRAKLEAVRESLRSGETSRRLAALERELSRAQVAESDWDLKLRIVKSEIEEAKYQWEHAKEVGRSGEAEWAALEEKEKEKAEIERSYRQAQARRGELESEIRSLRHEVEALEAELRTLAAERDRWVNRLDGLTINFDLGFAVLRLPKIPKIEQVVLPEYDRNAYDQPVARVDRCTSCHAGISKEGFENARQPYRTHPHLKELLWRHPTEKFGCTPCHEGQGAAVNSPAMAHGEVAFWERPLMRGERVQASCIGCHEEVRRLPFADQIASGEKLFEQLGCHGCHLVEGYDGLPKVGPSLRAVAAKVDPGWMVSWIENPQSFRPRTKMPHFLFDRQQAEQAAAYLLKASSPGAKEWLESHPEPRGVDPSNAELVRRGKELVDSIGCRGCHAVAPEEVASAVSETKDHAPNLSRIGEKTNARWLYHWLRDPRGYHPDTRMPSLRLSDGEAAAIASYLLTLRGDRAEASPADADLRERLASEELAASGEKLVRKYGCFGCHDIPGMERESRIGVELTTFGSKNLEELFFGDHPEIPRDWDHWTYFKLKDPRIYQTKFIEQLMPNFRLAESEIKALRVFLASRVDHRVPPRYRYPDPEGFQAALVQGRRLVDSYNCRGCHIIDEVGGDIRKHYEATPELAPPNLRGEGRKVQGDWLYAFLKAPSPIRPWLQVRMPTFGFSDEEARALVAYFQALERVKNPYVFVDERSIPKENLEAAERLVSEDYFSCFSCHQQGDKKPQGPPEGWAPDLAMARHRLNPEWIVDWIRDPQKLMPGTKMPSFYPGGPEDVFGGDEQRQIEALRDYLMTLGSTPAGAVRQAATASTRGSS